MKDKMKGLRKAIGRKMSSEEMKKSSVVNENTVEQKPNSNNEGNNSAAPYSPPDDDDDNNSNALSESLKFDELQDVTIDKTDMEEFNQSISIDELPSLSNSDLSLRRERSLRSTVHVSDPSDFTSSSSGNRSRRGSIMDFPEVDMILQELNKRVSTLESMVESISGGEEDEDDEDDKDHNGGTSSSDNVGVTILRDKNNKPIGFTSPQDPTKTTTVTITPEQKLALTGLSSNVRALIRCLRHRHKEQRDKILLAINDDNSDDELEKGGELTEKCDKLVRNAENHSKNKILGAIMGPAAEDNNHHNRRGLLGHVSSRRNTMGFEGESTPIPKILMEQLMGNSTPHFYPSSDHRNSDPAPPMASLNHAAFTTAAHLAHEYGGAELPQRFTVGNKRAVRRRTLKSFAKAIRGANTFVSHVKMEANFGKDDLEYLPREFTRLGLSERKRLATLLTWRGLKTWGFDAFEVERLSAVTLFQQSPSMRSVSSTAGGGGGGGGGSLSWNLDESEDGEDVVVETSKSGCPIVLIGWALLASPYSQLAMAKNVNDEELIEEAYAAIKQRSNTNNGNMAMKFIEDKGEEGSVSRGIGNVEEESSKKAAALDDGKASTKASPETKSETTSPNGEGGAEVKAKETGEKSEQTENSNAPAADAWNGGYFLPDEFEVKPRAVCHFLRKVEKEYSTRKVNPYHNNIHAADVIQSTHALIQMGGQDMALAYTPLEMYSILLAAAMHDVKHPGNNNNYEINKMSELSLRYNDNSVLENMHASRASHLLHGLEENSAGNDCCAAGILGSMTKTQQKMLRTSLIRSILSTDMSRHFSEIAKVTRHVEALEDDILEDNDGNPPSSSSSSANILTRINGDKHVKLREKFLPFLLHMADISNPTKPHAVSVEWARAVYDEFFQQGDREAAEDLPISPLCDRTTTNLPEAQVGFMNYVVKPAFLLLARCIPNMETVVIGQLEENFMYWMREKEKDNQPTGT